MQRSGSLVTQRAAHLLDHFGSDHAVPSQPRFEPLEICCVFGFQTGDRLRIGLRNDPAFGLCRRQSNFERHHGLDLCPSGE